MKELSENQLQKIRKIKLVRIGLLNSQRLNMMQSGIRERTSDVSVPQLGEGLGSWPPNNYGEMEKKKVLIDEFHIYISQVLKLDTFAAISGVKISKKFPGFSPGTPLGFARRVRHSPPLPPPKKKKISKNLPIYGTVFHCLYY